MLLGTGLLAANCSSRVITPGKQASATDTAAKTAIRSRNLKLPHFSWDHVPVAAHIGKRSGDFTQEEVQFLSKHFSLVTISNGQGMEKYAAMEDGMYQAARQLKAVAPDITLLFYWNSFLAYPRYRAYQTFADHPEWKLKTLDGKDLLIRDRIETYDLSQAAMRDWWIDAAQRNLAQAPFDGIFIDALISAVSERPALLGVEKATALVEGAHQLISELRSAVGSNVLLVYNGLRGDLEEWPDGCASFLTQTSGAMVEHFDFIWAHPKNGISSKEQIANEIELIQKAGKQGKIVLVKGWPSFSTISADAPPPENPEQAAREAITFPLACFLVAAGAYAYFVYSWGYTEDDGTFEWYPEFDKLLGSPRGDAVRDGWVYTRSFDHADVRVDLEQQRGVIEWL